MEIRRATKDNLEAMWAIFQAAIATGDTLPIAGTLDKDVFRNWLPDTFILMALCGDSHQPFSTLLWTCQGTLREG
jgi:hypothetical protein